MSEGTGEFPLSLFFAATMPPAGWVNGLGLAADLEWTAESLQGLIGFGVRGHPDVWDSLRPPLAVAFTALVNADPGCPAACDGDFARELLELFDADADGAISASELNDLAFSFFQPGLDLDYLAIVNGELMYWPERDGDSDHASMGLRIVAQRVEVIVP